MGRLPIRQRRYHHLGILHDLERSVRAQLAMEASGEGQASMVSQRYVERCSWHVECEMEGRVWVSAG